MVQRRFDVQLDNPTYNALRARLQQEGKTIEQMLQAFVQRYAAGGGIASQSSTYTVQRGDTLTTIARKVYGDAKRYPLLQRANNIDERGTIWVGQVLVVPPIPGLTPSFGGSQPAPATPTPPIAPSAPAPAAAPSNAGITVNPTLLNGGFDEFQPRFRDGKKVTWKGQEFPDGYGQHWVFKLLDEKEAKRTHVQSSEVFGRFAQAYFGGHGLNYKYAGKNSQVIVSQYGFDVLLLQTVAAQPGREYTFAGRYVSYFKGTDNPATPGKIFKTLGIDPYGGQDHESPNVVWGPRVDTDHAWMAPSIQATAQAGAITVFIRIENTEENVGQTELNIIHLDDFRLY